MKRQQQAKMLRMRVTGSMKERSLYIDVAKLLAIIGVFLGHHQVLNTTTSNWFWAWHMTLFYFVTGYCSKTVLQDKLNVALEKGLKKLVLPYFVTISMLAIATLLITQKEEVITNWKTSLQWLGDYLIYRETPIWFLMSLFWGRLLVAVMSHYSYSTRLIISMAVFIIAIIIGNSTINVFLPLSITRGFQAPLFIYLGAICRNFNLIFICRKSYIFIVAIIFNAHYVPINMFYYDFPIGLWNVATSTIICIAIINVAYWLERFTKYNSYILLMYRILAYYGSATLLFLCLHTVEITLNLSRFIGYKNTVNTNIILVLILCLTATLNQFKIVRKIYS